MEAFPYISKRFALERFLGLSEEEINKNEKMWREENGKESDVEASSSDLRNIGVSAGDIDSDLETAEGIENNPEEGEQAAGPEVVGPVGNDAGGQPAPSAGGM
jgi:hypothetical protein